MKKILALLFIFVGFAAKAQVYNNEWIDYSKTYYKFKVGQTGLYRITGATLQGAGLGAATAKEFQLWRNGVQVPLFTSIAEGAFSATDYIEFWGEMNDGKSDKPLYRNPDYQLNDKWSLQTDTAAYFLTLNQGENLRLTTTVNQLTGNTLAPEPFFMHTAGMYYKEKINAGYAVPVGENLYSSAYDKGEGYTSADILKGGIKTATFANLFTYTAGPANATFKIAASGNGHNTREYKVTVNGTTLIGANKLDYYNYGRDSVAVPVSILATNTALVSITNLGVVANDRMVVHQFELVYPRKFDFGNATNFEFSLPASAGNYLEITGFKFGTTAPVLYDITNGKRYKAELAGTLVKVVLQPSATDRKLVLVSQDVTNLLSVGMLQSRTFINYALAENAGNYIIISNPILFSSAGGANPVEEYRLYRSSAEGGSYTAKTYIADDLVDQFAFGIKKHPLSIRNFLQFARAQFPVAPKQVFLMGKGIQYVHQRQYENTADIEKLNLVPTFGNPASDVMLSANPGDSYPQIPIGRLSVINGDEIAIYLKKVKEHELAQRTPSPLISEKAWMKNVVHIVGASEPVLQAMLDEYMTKYKGIIEDTLFGAKVTTFTKTSANSVEQINNGLLDRLFEEGITLMTYFGHSSSSTLEFNLNNPAQYNNHGKYPMFIALGCNAGNFYNFALDRLQVKETLSEKYVLAADRGTIGFIASSHFGIPLYLDIFTTEQYKSISSKDYGKTMGEIMQSTIGQVFEVKSQEDFYARANAEETSLHGDPAIRLNPHPKPDYVIEEQMVKVAPLQVSVADNFFTIKAKILNIGKAVNTNVVVQVKREFPDKSVAIIYRDTIPGIRFADSAEIKVFINPLKDKGSNKFTIAIDADNVVDELFETNNSITKEIFVFDDDARPVYPYNFSIINHQITKLIASTANPLSDVQTYKMEIDTTENFNSSLKVDKTLTSGGGVLEFEPGLLFKDSTVYYWRVGRVKADGIFNWSTSSFIYLEAQVKGFNQSHFFQHTKSSFSKLLIDSASRWQFGTSENNLFMRNGVFPSAASNASDFEISVNGDPYIRSVCGISNIIVNVFDPLTFKPWKNADAGQPGSYGSDNVCGPERIYNFQFNILDTGKRRMLVNFLDMIPSEYYVVVKNVSGTSPASNTYPSDWKKDTLLFGKNNSIYHRLYSQGFAEIDSFNRPRAWIFTYQKDNRTNFKPKYIFSNGTLDKITLSSQYSTKDTTGFVISPLIGPSKQWKAFTWSGQSIENPPSDSVFFNVLGIGATGVLDTIAKNINFANKAFDLSNVNSAQYPFIQLMMKTTDVRHQTPFQLKYWRVLYAPAPEGAVAANQYYTPVKDSIEVGEPTAFRIAFKNVSDENFDSLKVKVTLTDNNNVSDILLQEYRKPLLAGDTLRLEIPIDSKKYSGNNSILVDFNPDNDQPEQYRFNNFIYQNLFVKGDSLSPVLDVTFDNVHILNGDIVSAKPGILISLQDEAKWKLLNDTALATVQVRFPDENGQLSQSSLVRTYGWNSDTLKFYAPVDQGANSVNTATLAFNPYFTEDGNYELIVTGKDKSNNKAGDIEYRVGFQVISKAMISNMLNYPNPFTTSTAFVFTITGSEVPQNIKIQILTVTGKIVREITKEELGPLRIGRNITEYKWNGTDQYGQRLANGVYIYRVVTNLNGKSLEKYRAKTDDTDKYFNKGYGKMYLMR